MDVRDGVAVGAEGLDQVALHDLHVVGVVEKLDARRADRADHRGAPSGMVGHVTGVVAPGVKQLHADGDPVRFGDRHDALEPGDRVARALVVADAVTQAGKGDHVGHVRLPGERDAGSEPGDDLVVVLRPVQAVIDLAAARIAHGAAEPVARGDRVFLGFEQVHADETERSRVFAELRYRPLPEAPAGNGLADPPAARLGFLGRDCGCRRSRELLRACAYRLGYRRTGDGAGNPAQQTSPGCVASCSVAHAIPSLPNCCVIIRADAFVCGNKGGNCVSTCVRHDEAVKGIARPLLMDSRLSNSGERQIADRNLQIGLKRFYHA